MLVLILICSMALNQRDCNRETATKVVELPGGAPNDVLCGLGGQAFLAGTSIGQELKQDERVKILCITPQRGHTG